MDTFHKIVEASKHSPYCFPSPVATYVTLANQGPPTLRPQIKGLGINLYENNPPAVALKLIERIFAGLSSTMKTEEISSCLKRRIKIVLSPAKED